MSYPVIVEAIRSPFGRRAGAFRDIRPDALLAVTLARLIKRSGVDSTCIDDVIVGCVSQAGEQSANLARQASLLAGLPVTTAGVTLNRMCGSGQTSVHIAAQAAYDAAFKYTQERVAFGKTISEFQAVKHKLADMATELNAARAFAHSVAKTLDRGIRCNTEAGMVKLFCFEMAANVTKTAMLLHGGIGYAVDTDVNRYWRDGMLMSIGEGTSDIQREIISKGLLNAK